MDGKRHGLCVFFGRQESCVRLEPIFQIKEKGGMAVLQQTRGLVEKTFLQIR